MVREGNGSGGRRITEDQRIAERIETVSAASLVPPTGSIREPMGVEIVAGSREIPGRPCGARSESTPRVVASKLVAWANRKTYRDSLHVAAFSHHT